MSKTLQRARVYRRLFWFHLVMAVIAWLSGSPLVTSTFLIVALICDVTDEILSAIARAAGER